MTLAEFKDWLKAIEDYLEQWEKANKGIDLICSSSYGLIELGGGLLDKYIAMLSKYIGEESDIISYFVFECELGKEPRKITVDGKDFILNSVESLYEAIVYNKS